MAGTMFTNKRARTLAFISNIYSRGTRELRKGDTNPRVVSPAETAVLQTAELLESILSHLPGDIIPRARLICQQWNELITTSPTLRERILLDRLWYIPYGDYPTRDHIAPAFRLAPTSSNMTPARGDLSKIPPRQMPNTGDMIVLRPALLHPLFYKDSGDRPDWYFATGQPMRVRLNLDLTHITTGGAAVIDPSTTGLITAPPCHHAMMTVRWTAYHRQRDETIFGEVHIVLGDESGLTIKNLLDAFLQQRGTFSYEKKVWGQQSTDDGATFDVEIEKAGMWTFSEAFAYLTAQGYGEAVVKNCYLALYGVVVPRQSQLESLSGEKKDMGEFLKEVGMKG